MERTTRLSKSAALLLALLLLCAPWRAAAQTTISTTYTTPANGIVNANSAATFVVQNTTASPIVISDVGVLLSTTYVSSGSTTCTLWATTSSLSGAATIATPTWTALSTGSISVTGATLASYSPFAGLSYLIPASSTVRFAVQSTGGIFYAGTAATPATPNTHSAAGVNLLTGNATLSGLNVGYGGGFPSPANNPRFFAGSITFSALAPCAGTPNPGATTSNVLGACTGQTITLGLQNSIPGSGVSYAWEFDNGGGWTAFGTDAATQTVTQSTSTSYRCNVTCTSPGGGSATSTPIAIPMATGWPVQFTQTLFPSNCWTRSGTAPTFLTRDNANGFALPGTGSAKWDFWSANAGTTQILTSPAFAPLTGSKQVTFDVAGAKWTDASIDQITLQYSTAGTGGPWTNIVVMTNGLGGDLNTAGEVAAAFVPTGTQWARRSFPVPAGANAIRFEGTAGFGNNVYIDNIVIEDVLACPTPAGLTAAISSTSSAQIGWTLNAAASYSVEVRSSGAPGSGPAGLSASGTVAAPPFAATGLTLGQSYWAYVRGDCGVDGLSQWSAPISFSLNYCAASAANTNPANIATVSNVAIAGINQGNASVAGYVDFSAVTGSMAPGAPYNFTFTRSNNYTFDQFLVWVDWNGDLDFDDAGENVFTSPVGIGAGPYNGIITCPPGTAPGNKRMRIRRQYVDVANGFQPNNTPCGNSTFGQVLDFTLNVCGAAVATTTVNDNCGAGTFGIDVNIASNPGGAMTINWVATPGGPGSMPASLGLNTLPVSFPANAQVNVSLSNGTLCVADLGDHFSNCPITVSCGSTVTVSHCYRNNDPRTFTFLASNPAETVTLTFIAGTMDPNDVIRAYSGTDNSGTPIVELTGTFANLGSPQVTGTSLGNALFLEIDSDGGNSCYNGGAQSTWVFEVECTPGCVDPDGSVTPNVNCLSGSFTLDVEVSFTGDGTTVDLLHSVNGAPQAPILGLQANDIETLGPFAIGTIVNVVLAHESDAGCNKNLGTFQPGLSCPPPNDDCANAQLLAINPIANCPGGGVTGTTANATNDGPAPTCNNVAGTIRDVWYRFNSGTFGSPIRIQMSGGTATSYALALYDGPGCLGSLIGCLANGPTLINFNGATPNTDYYLRVFTNSGTGAAGTFNICLSASQCPAPTAQTATEVTNATAQINWTGPAGSYIVEYGPAATFTTPGLGATPGPGGTIVTAATSPVVITGLAPGTQYRFFVRRDCGVDGFSLNTFATVFTTLAAPPQAGEICGTAIVIPSVPATVSGSTTDFANNYNTTTCDQNVTGGRDVVYSYTPSVNQVLDLTLCVGTTNYDSKLMVYQNDCGGPLYACQDDGCQAPLYGGGPFNSQITGLSVTAGNTYYFVIDGYSAADFGNYTLQISVGVPPPANDACANAIVLTPAATCSPVAGTTVSATQSVAPSTCSAFTSSAANDVWYSFTATRTTHRITVAGQGAFDPILELRSGACNGTSVACVDATINGQTEVLTVPGLSIGQTYLVRVYGWAGGTGTFTICVEEPDCNGVFGGTANPGTACDDGDAGTAFDAYNGSCACSGTACTTSLSLLLQLDGISTLTWELREQGTNALAQSGSAYLPGTGELTVGTCLPDGCYYLRVTDDGGDGVVGGGYLLRITDAQRLIDNRGNFTSGSVSQITGGEGFCLPIGTDRLIFASCDKLDWRTSPCSAEFVVANDNPVVTAQYGVTNATSGYEMWWYDPNGGYSFRRFQSHSTTNGLPASATRACHFQINGWSGNQLQQGVLYNVKVRGRVNGVNNAWGPACRFMIDNAAAQCPRTKLLDDPGNQFLSCGQTRAIGANVLVHARPVRRINNNCNWVNANRYQFRFRLPDENVTIIKTAAVGTGNYFVNTNGLVCGKTYQVDVRASFDGGTTWCVTTPNPNSVSDPAWGDVCTLSTVACPGNLAQQPGGVSAAEQRMQVFPNPNRGDRLNVWLSGVEPGVEQARLELHDAFGRLVLSRNLPVADGLLRADVVLEGAAAQGLYLVTLTAGTQVSTERIVVQP